MSRSPNQAWLVVGNQVGGIEWPRSPARERSFSVGLKQSIADGRKGSVIEMLPERKYVRSGEWMMPHLWEKMLVKGLPRW